MTDSCVIPMPEGDYPATYTDDGRWWSINIPGGIPVPGKAEDAHNTGLDGVWGSDNVHDERTPTIEAACEEIARSIVNEREQTGYTLPFPMTVGQAKKLARYDRTDLLRVLDRLADEDRLRCVVDGETTADGKPAPLCPSIISDPEGMCAGCAAQHVRYAAGSPRDDDDKGPP